MFKQNDRVKVSATCRYEIEVGKLGTVIMQLGEDFSHPEMIGIKLDHDPGYEGWVSYFDPTDLEGLSC